MPSSGWRTCVGIELTGKPAAAEPPERLPARLRPNTQDDGGPTSDDDPEIQIERLALWDGSSEKLVQVNHPDIGWMFRDRNGDGTPDTGFAGMAGQMDVIEVHPLNTIFDAPTTKSKGKTAEQHHRELASAPEPGSPHPGCGEHRRPLQLPRVGLAEKLPEEPDR